MKVLIYCGQRTGSTALLNWVHKELNLTPIFEPFTNVEKGDARYFNLNWFNDFDGFLKLDSVVAKVIHGTFNYFIHENEVDSKVFTKFDKVIVLYRENLLEQAKSLIIAKDIIRNYFHEYDYNAIKDQVDEHIDDQWVRERIGIEWAFLERTKTLKNCEVFSYEEIFENGNHERLLRYLEITEPKHLDILDNKNRYRKTIIEENQELNGKEKNILRRRPHTNRRRLGGS